MQLKETGLGLFLVFILAGCGGGGGSDSGDEITQELPVTENPPTLVSGFTLEQRRAHKQIINADYAENRSITGAGVKVAVFDGGVNIDHAEFNGRTINQASRTVRSGFNVLTKEEHQFTAENKYRTFDIGPQKVEGGHGTAVTSLIIGEEGGIAKDVDLLHIDISLLTSSGETSLFVDSDVTIGMIDELADSGFDFFSASNGGIFSIQYRQRNPVFDPENLFINDGEFVETPFWRKLATRDVGLIKGAGNDAEDLTEKLNTSRFSGENSTRTFAVKDDVVAPQYLWVGAVTNDGELADFSNTPGSDTDIQARFIMAPGKDIVMPSHLNDESLVRQFGTSFSTPIVTGAAALVKSQNPTLSNSSVLTVLLESADRSFEGYDAKLHGQGILDIEAALKFDVTGLD